MYETIGKFLGLDDVRQIDAVDLALAAAWAQDRVFWVFLGAVGLLLLAITFYLRWQLHGSRPWRLALGICRGLLLAVLLITLADPILQITLTHRQTPHLFLVFDGTDSMAIEDEYPADQQSALLKAVGVEATSTSAATSRSGLVQAFLSKKDGNLLEQLRKKHQVDFTPFLFDGNTTSKLRKLELSSEGDDSLDPAHLATQLTTQGQVTALGSALSDAANQFGVNNLAGVVLFSDFAQNAGPSPLGDRKFAPALRLGAPIYTVGVGAVEAVDVAVDLQTDPKMKKAERSTLVVKVRQSGLDGRTAAVTITGERLSGEASSASPQEFTVGTKSVTFNAPVQTVEFPITPDESGRFKFTASIEKLEGEIVDQNNRSTREVQIIDDYLRLLYVANEPNWEWRFVKEVFHRDKLVGMDGFRTFLASSDPRVREGNVLFLPSLTPKRSEFFANDVIFLADMPRNVLNDRFCEMVKEYVGNLGGGLVVIAGPEFGLRELQGTALADMLPVIIDPQSEIRSAPKYPEFKPRLTPHANRYSFMQLGASDLENQQAWSNLGKLPWYQPVAAVHEQATVLAEYPAGGGDSAHLCKDGRTPQPLIAIRHYGRGEVVYIAFNEMWRLRRKYGEKYYRAFWSQLIYRLGMSHAMGNEKRFVVSLDQTQYRVEDKALLTVEAYDENYEPLDDLKLAGRTLQAELTLPVQAEGTDRVRSLTVPLLRPGMFEARIPVLNAGEYSLRVKDPITNKFEELRFDVTSVSAERRRGVRDLELQTQIAHETRGKAYDLTNVHNLVRDLEITPKLETQTRNFPLWATPWWFGLVVTLMLGEWLVRKIVKLT